MQAKCEEAKCPKCGALVDVVTMRSGRRGLNFHTRRKPSAFDPQWSESCDGSWSTAQQVLPLVQS